MGRLLTGLSSFPENFYKVLWLHTCAKFNTEKLLSTLCAKRGKHLSASLKYEINMWTYQLKNNPKLKYGILYLML